MGLTSKKGNNTDVKRWPDSESSVVESHRLTWRRRTGQVVFLSNQRPQLFHEYRNKQPRSRHGNNTANDDRSSLTPEATPHDSQQMLCFLSPKSSTPPTHPLPPPDKEATGRMQGTSKHLQYSLEVLGKGGGRGGGKHKSKNKNKRQTFSFFFQVH